MRPISRSRLVFALAALASAISAGRAAGQSAIGLTFTVRADASHEPLSGAHVEVMGTGRAANTAADGTARLRVAPGPALIEVRRLGFATERFSINLPQADTMGIDVDLREAAIRLAGVTATSTATELALRESGFYDRQRMGIGVFLTARDINRHPAARTVDALRRVPGVRLVRYLEQGRRAAGDGDPSATNVVEDYRIAAARGSASIVSGGSCFMNLYVDDIDMGDAAMPNIPVRDVVAMEVYRGSAETPARYRKAMNGCGAVVIWTTRGRPSS